MTIPSLAGAGQAWLHFSGNALEGHGQCALHRSCMRGRAGYSGGAAQTGSNAAIRQGAVCGVEGISSDSETLAG